MNNISKLISRNHLCAKIQNNTDSYWMGSLEQYPSNTLKFDTQLKLFLANEQSLAIKSLKRKIFQK